MWWPIIIDFSSFWLGGMASRQAKIATECLGFILELEMKRRGRREAVEAPAAKQQSKKTPLLEETVSVFRSMFHFSCGF